MSKIQKIKVWYYRRAKNKFTNQLLAKYGPVWWKDVHPAMTRAEYFHLEDLNAKLAKAWVTKSKKKNDVATVENGRKLREENVTGRIVHVSNPRMDPQAGPIHDLSYTPIPKWWSESKYHNEKHMPTKDSRSWRQRMSDREKRKLALEARREEWNKNK